MIRTLIISGGNINLEFVKNICYNNNVFDIIIAADKGLETLDKLGIKPNYIIGDFDSISKMILNKYNENIIKLKPEKDYTDTHMALKLAMELKSNEIVILGAIGTRIDHVLANIHILKEATEKGISCRIINERNKIFLINKTTHIKKDDNYKYFSIIPLSTKVTGITLKGFKYLLENAELSIGQSIGVSNEQIEEVSEIQLEEGILIIIYSKD